jgi:predicted dinucleotide-binding enzyme
MTVIAVVGVGRLGGTLSRLLARAGHQVVLTSRSAARVEALRVELGEAASSTDLTGAALAAAAGVLLLAVPGLAVEGLLPELSEALAAAVRPTPERPTPPAPIVLDATNPYAVRRDAPQGVWLQERLPEAQVVRGLNTMIWETVRDGAFRRGTRRLVVPISADDPAATKTVAALIRSIGFAPEPIGTLARSARQDPGGPLYGREVTEASRRERAVAEAVRRARAAG